MIAANGARIFDKNEILLGTCWSPDLVAQVLSYFEGRERDVHLVVTAENIDVLLGKLNTTLLNLGNLGKTENETAVELPETGPSTGVSQKPEELRNQNK